MGNSIEEAYFKAMTEKVTEEKELRSLSNGRRNTVYQKRHVRPEVKQQLRLNKDPRQVKHARPLKKAITKPRKSNSQSVSQDNKTAPLWKVTFSKSAEINEAIGQLDKRKTLLTTLHSGISEQPPGTCEDVRDLVMGFDFGTSTTKVVISDRILKKSFAVKFSSELGIESFLIPSQVYSSGKSYSLSQDGRLLSDLKLPLMEKQICDVHQLYAAIAYIALVIRHSRGWLFSERADIYKNTKIYWRFTLGIPSENYENKSIVERFTQVAKAAWKVSCNLKEDVTNSIIEDAHRYCRQRESGLEVVDVVPEIAAQIYGFAQSHRFDPDKSNIFLIADIGSGTLDSSVFQVRKGRGGKYDFEFFTAQVEQNGVTELHKIRIAWLKNVLETEGTEFASRLLRKLEESGLRKGLDHNIPDNLNEYIDGADLCFHGEVKQGCPYPEGHPDGTLFNRNGKVSQQIRGYTFFKAKDYMNSRNLDGIPLFLCGGGARMAIYEENIYRELSGFPGYPWLQARKSNLEIPENLEALSVIKTDYDRLSVAYGLSFLEIGKIIRALPLPKILPKRRHYEDNYIGQEQV